MEGYFVRINSHPGYEESIIRLSDNDDYTHILCVKHKGEKGENAHYHLTLKTAVKQQALRVRLRNIFDQGEGNKHMSMKKWDGDTKANSYMFHEETHHIILNKGYTDDEINDMKKTNEKIQIEIDKAKSKASWKLEEVVLKRLAKDNLGGISQREIAKMILEEAFQSDKYQPNDFQLKAMADRIRYKSSARQEDKEAVIYSIIDRIKWN